MATEQSTPSLEISNTRVFDYRREVIVELHGRTTGGEFEVVSYAFTEDPDDETQLESPDIEATHEEVVYEALAETEYTLD